ncbi:MAG: SpoIVB peptidase S55 domain-containing protein [Bryobacteraceae bacterium]
MGVVLRLAAAGLALCACHAQTALFPLKEIKPGLRGVGKTVFLGDRIENFQVEILGVLENVGPKRSLILARLSGGPLAQTGVLQGMSGSPVYISGKLAGAVAMAFTFSKEAIAGIRPIEEMLPVAAAAPSRRVGIRVEPENLLAGLPEIPEVRLGATRLTPIATPVRLAGFTQGTIERFGPQLRGLGLEPVQGVSGGSSRVTALGDPSRLKPGSMISVQLARGDFSAGADGTVTHIDGNRVYAFGHRFLAIGSADLPFARAEVLTLLPSLNTSFKISSTMEPLGVIAHDRDTAIAGELGRQARMIPVAIHVKGAANVSYRMEIVNDRFLTPFLVQLMTYSAIDATERMAGPGSVTLRGQISFDGEREPLRVANLYSGDTVVAAQVALGAALPLAYVLQSSFERLRPRSVTLDISLEERKRQAVIVDAYPSRRTVKPGETVELFVVLRGDGGADQVRKVAYRIPPGMSPGTVNFTILDALAANLMEIRKLLNTPKSASQLIETVNTLRTSEKAYVRVWRNEPSYTADGAELPDPPASVAMILAKMPSQPGILTSSQGARLAELEIDAAGLAVTGSRTAQVEVKE